MHSNGDAQVVESPGQAKSRCTRGEASLLDAYRKGERQALQLVESWIRTAVGRSRRELIRGRSDVVQEVHLRILTNLHRGTFRGDSSFKTYVWGVTRYTSLAFVREERKHFPPVTHEPEEMPTPRMSPEQRFIASERATQVANALRKLSLQEQRLFQLLYCQGLDYRSVGRELGIPVGTVKSRVSRFRSALTRRVASARLAPIARRASDAAGTTRAAHRRTGSEA